MEPQQPMEGAPTPSPAPEQMQQPAPQPMQPMAAPQPMMGEQPQPTMQQPMAASPMGVDPGKGMGVASLILAFFIPLVGLILGIIAKGKSKKAGFKNSLALAGIIISIVGMVVQLIFGALFLVGILATVQKCKDLGPGTHYENGTTITCN
jgi:hypothetical protein